MGTSDRPGSAHKLRPNPSPTGNARLPFKEQPAPLRTSGGKKKLLKSNSSVADAKYTRGFFNTTKAIYGPSTHGQAPLKSKEGTTILKSKTKIGARWREHFEDLLTHNAYIYDRSVLDMITNRAKDDSLSPIPSLEEVRNATKAMKDNKAAVPDRIPEIYKLGGGLIIHPASPTPGQSLDR